MWKLWVQLNAAFVALVFVVLSAVFLMHGQWPEWNAVGAFGAAGALVFAFASYVQLARHHRERVRKHRTYWAKMQEIVDELAKRSLIEKSIFFDAFEKGEDGEIILTTSIGNANCRALEQMADLGITRPIPIEPTGNSESDTGAIRYRLD